MVYIDSEQEFIQIPRTAGEGPGYTPAPTPTPAGVPAVSLDLPEESTEYVNTEEMLADIGLSSAQLDQMLAGGFVYVYDRQKDRFLPFMVITRNEVFFGYYTSDGADYYFINFELHFINHTEQ